MLLSYNMSKNLSRKYQEEELMQEQESPVKKYLQGGGGSKKLVYVFSGKPKNPSTKEQGQ